MLTLSLEISPAAIEVGVKLLFIWAGMPVSAWTECGEALSRVAAAKITTWINRRKETGFLCLRREIPPAPSLLMIITFSSAVFPSGENNGLIIQHSV